MKRLNNFLHLILLFLFLISESLPGQQSTENIRALNQDTIKQGTFASSKLASITFIEEYKRLNEELPGEKIYLHLDRPNYMQGDTIWFKAYSWIGPYQMPDTLSRVLYIELISPAGKVKLSRKVLIHDGTSHGDISLDTTIVPGRYTIRAYTRWMQNMNTGEPFYQNITINPLNQNFQIECTPVIIKQAENDSLRISFRFFEIDQGGDLKSSLNHEVNYSLKIGDRVLHSGNVMATNTKVEVIKSSLSGIDKNDSSAVFELSVRDNRLTFEKQFQIPLLERIDIRFFPEGGRQVNGLEGKIAFKAIGTDGLSREVKGEIKDKNENFITGFESSRKGMGAFLLKPKSGEKYYAHLWYNNLKYVIRLPDASEDGCTMAMDYTGSSNNPFLIIKQKHLETTAQKYVVGSAYGKIWFSALVKMAKDSCRFQIPIELLPEGVCRLTVLNGDFKPECERLVYADKKQRFKIEVIPDSSSYGTRSKVTLLIKTTGPDGAPVQADLSLAVVDKEQTMGNSTTSGIRAYKLLESELQWYIEDAGFYFKDDSCMNSPALDLLMLTQGYRKFVPGNTNPDELKYQPERNFDISGKIKFNGLKLWEKGFNYSSIGLTLMCKSEEVYLDQTRSDSLGRFRFQIPLLFGKSHSLLQATTLKGKPFYSKIFLDESVNPPRFNPPLFVNNNITLPAVEYIHNLQAIKKTDVSKIPGYGAMSVTLGEVKVTAKAKNWFQDFKKEAIKIANLDSLDPEGNRYGTIYDLLIREFGAKERTILPGLKTILLPSEGWGPPYWFPIYLINGKVYFNGAEHGEMFKGWLNHISTIKVNEIKRLMVLPPGNIPSYYADPVLRMHIGQSLVVIETYSNDWYRGNPQGIRTFILDGLDVPRVFYSPHYDYPKKENQIYDGRAIIYWNPLIRTDSAGQTKAEFFTSDRQTSLEVIVNGIEVGSGNPGQGIKMISSILSDSNNKNRSTSSKQ